MTGPMKWLRDDQSSLEAFRRWVERTTFIPRPNMHIRVKVSSGAATVPTRACADCVSKWEGSRILEVMKMINWTNLTGLDITVVVSCVVINILYTAINSNQQWVIDV